MKKRAQMDMTVGELISMILLVIIVAAMLVRIYKESMPNRFEKEFLSKDIALFIDTIYASPNRVTVVYPQNIYDYSFKITEGEINVFKKDESFDLGISSKFNEEEKKPVEKKELIQNIAIGSDDPEEVQSPKLLFTEETKKIKVSIALPTSEVLKT